MFTRSAHPRCHCDTPHLAAEGILRRLGAVWSVTLRTSTPGPDTGDRPYRLAVRWENPAVGLLAVRYSQFDTPEEAKAAFSSALLAMHISPQYATFNW